MPGSLPLGPVVTRRRFLALVGGGIGSYVLLPRFEALPAAACPLGGPECPDPPPEPPALVRRLSRREDMVAISFTFSNLALNAAGDALERVDPDQAAFIVADVGPQALTEELRPVGDDPNHPPPAPQLPVRAQAARRSEIAFRLPDRMLSYPFTLAALLDWTALPLSVVRDGWSNPSSGPYPPPKYGTGIEMPWGVVLSPNEHAGFAHAKLPVTSARSGTARTELWHSRLVARRHSPVSSDDSVPVRVVYGSTDEPLGTGPGLFHLERHEFPLQDPPGSRDALVYLTAPRANRNAVPASAKRLMVTGLGGYLDVEGEWDPKWSGAQGLSISSWKQRITMGRDQYVEVKQEGYLMPFGHRAVYFAVGERRTEVSGKSAVAFLDSIKYLVVTEPERSYDGSGSTQQSRSWPLRRVRVLTTKSPLLDSPRTGAGGSFFPTYDGGRDVLFDLVSTDGEGREVHLSVPAMFVPVSGATDPGVVADYNRSDAKTRRTSGLAGQRLAYARYDGQRPGATAHETSTLVVRAGPAPGADPPFLPAMEKATIRLAAVEQLSGKTVGGSAGVDIAYDDVYLGAQAGPSGGGVYAKLLSPSPASFPADRAGGMATPDYAITALSSSRGPVGGSLELARADTFRGNDLFADSARFLGGVGLKDIIGIVGADALPLDRAPAIVTELGGAGGAAPPTRRTTRLSWPDAPLKPSGPFRASRDEAGHFPAHLELSATIVAELADPQQSTSEVHGEARDFAILAGGGLITVEVNRFAFTSRTGTKPSFDVDIAGVTFGGALAFVQDLSKLVSFASGNGVALNVTPGGVDATLSLAVPSLAVGVFALQNLSLATGVTLPFDGSPMLCHFDFCRPDQPFLLTIAFFSGGGYVGATFGLDGVKEVRAGLYFGAAVALDFGVASGSVSVYATIMFQLTDGDIKIAGGLRMHGQVEVLGVAGVSLDAYAGFDYDSHNQKVTARLSLTLSAELAGISHTVGPFEVEHKFGGSGDPTFEQMVLPSDWSDYCGAFAPAGG